MKAIAVFNNKGGVGKTTLLCNVASYFKVKKSNESLLLMQIPNVMQQSISFHQSE